jgi:hypothetical protein
MSAINSKGWYDLVSSSCLFTTMYFVGSSVLPHIVQVVCRQVIYIPVCVCVWGWDSQFCLIVSFSTSFYITFFWHTFHHFPLTKPDAKLLKLTEVVQRLRIAILITLN